MPTSKDYLAILVKPKGYSKLSWEDKLSFLTAQKLLLEKVSDSNFKELAEARGQLCKKGKRF